MNQTEIYNKYSWILFQLSNKYGNSSNYQDLFQEGFLALIKCHERFNSKIGTFDKFAKTCVRNRMLNFLRCRNFVGMVDVCIEKDDYIWEYLPELTKEEQEMFDLWSSGYTYKEICNIKGLSMSKVKRKICTLLKKIRNANEKNINSQ